jgi:hypothetical protein
MDYHYFIPRQKNKPIEFEDPNFVCKISRAYKEKPKETDAISSMKKGMLGNIMNEHVKNRNFQQM